MDEKDAKIRYLEIEVSYYRRGLREWMSFGAYLLYRDKEIFEKFVPEDERDDECMIDYAEEIKQHFGE